MRRRSSSSGRFPANGAKSVGRNAAFRGGHLPTSSRVIIYLAPKWGRTGFDGDVEAGVAGRGAAGLVKSGNTVIANNNNNYAYAYAA